MRKNVTLGLTISSLRTRRGELTSVGAKYWKQIVDLESISGIACQRAAMKYLFPFPFSLYCCADVHLQVLKSLGEGRMFGFGNCSVGNMSHATRLGDLVTTSDLTNGQLFRRESQV